MYTGASPLHRIRTRHSARIRLRWRLRRSLYGWLYISSHASFASTIGSRCAAKPTASESSGTKPSSAPMIAGT